MFDRKTGVADLELALGALRVNAYALGWVVLGAAFLDAFSSALFGASPSIVIGFVMQGLVMFAVMRTLLTGGTATGRAALKTVTGELPGAFVLRLALLAIPGLLALVLIANLILPVLGETLAVGIGLPASLVAQAGVLAVFGSMLPRIAEGKPGRVSRALMRGQGRVQPVMMTLLTGPVVAELIVDVVLMGLVAAGLPHEIVPDGAAHISLVGAVVDLGYRAASALIGAYYGAVLTRAYLEQRRADDGPINQ